MYQEQHRSSQMHFTKAREYREGSRVHYKTRTRNVIRQGRTKANKKGRQRQRTVTRDKLKRAGRHTEARTQVRSNRQAKRGKRYRRNMGSRVRGRRAVYERNETATSKTRVNGISIRDVSTLEESQHKNGIMVSLTRGHLARGHACVV